MEEEFLDLGFIDENFLNDVPPIQEEKQEEIKEEEKETKIEDKLSEPEVKEEEKKETKQESEENPKNTGAGSPNLSSSIANALVDRGVLRTLGTERLNGIKDAESLIDAFEEEVNSRVDERLDEVQKRVNNALNYGIEPTKIQQYEQWINTLDKVTNEVLEGEEEKNENYRKNLIYRNYLNKGFDENEALEMVNRSVESGKDIDDAKKALSSLKKYYKDAYDSELTEAKKQYEAGVETQKKQFDALKTSIMEDKEKFYDQFEMPKSMRQKVFDVITKPTVKAGDKSLTPIQAFIQSDPNKANKIIGTLYVLTEGFTKFEGIMKGTVKKQVRESMKNLERALNQTKPIDGDMIFRSGIGEDASNVQILDFDFED